MKPRGLLVVLNHRENIDPGQFCATIQEVEFHREGCADDYAAQLAHHLDGRRGGAAGGE